MVATSLTSTSEPAAMRSSMASVSSSVSGNSAGAGSLSATWRTARSTACAAVKPPSQRVLECRRCRRVRNAKRGVGAYAEAPRSDAERRGERHPGERGANPLTPTPDVRLFVHKYFSATVCLSSFELLSKWKLDKEGGNERLRRPPYRERRGRFAAASP